MVLGLWEGKMEILLPKNHFSRGETIDGTVKLTLNKEKHARQLKIRIWGEEEYTYMSKDSKGDPMRKTSRREIYSFEQVLDGEKDYPARRYEYPFSLQAPAQQASEHESPKLSFGGLTLDLGSSKNVIRWFIGAALDVPMSIDIGKKVQISIG